MPWFPVGNLWKICGNLWKIYGKSMENLWKIYGKIKMPSFFWGDLKSVEKKCGKSMENIYGKINGSREHLWHLWLIISKIRVNHGLIILM